eukprot:c22679_g11_i1 orf=31-567(+)
MGGTIQQLWSLGLLKEEDWRCQDNHRHRSYGLDCKEFLSDDSNSKPSPAHPDFKHTDTEESLCINGFVNPSWVSEDHRRRAPSVSRQARHGEPYAKNEKETHEKAHSRNGEVKAFVASLRACAKTKDLSKGTRIHDDIRRRGLLAQCSDALVAMYAKCGALERAHAVFYGLRFRDIAC